MVNWDDDSSSDKKSYMLGQNLEAFSIEELNEMIARLYDEIERLKADKQAKKKATEAASEIFK